MLKRFLSTVVVGVCAVSGCVKPNTEAVERGVNTFVEDVAKPAVNEGIKQGISSLAVQAGAQVINPEYEVKGRGVMVNGFEFQASVALKGAAGQAQITTVGTDRTVTSPHAASQPSS